MICDDNSDSDGYIFEDDSDSDSDGFIFEDNSDGGSDDSNSDNSDDDDESHHENDGTEIENMVSTPSQSDSESDASETAEMDVTENNSHLLEWILTLFFRIQYRFNISSKAASAILSLIAFIINLLHHPLSTIFPKTLTSAKNKSAINTTIQKEKYAVCPNINCNALYKITDQIVKKCNKRVFNRVCGREMGYEKHLSGGKKKWKPFKMFQFVSPSTWLKKMLSCDEFASLLEHSCDWPDSEILEDVYDGRVWKELSAHGFNRKYDIRLMLNVDWYKPFKRSEYKVAALMLTVLNLPRQMRYKKKWTIIAGLPQIPILHLKLCMLFSNRHHSRTI